MGKQSEDRGAREGLDDSFGRRFEDFEVVLHSATWDHLGGVGGSDGLHRPRLTRAAAWDAALWAKKKRVSK